MTPVGRRILSDWTFLIRMNTRPNSRRSQAGNGILKSLLFIGILVAVFMMIRSNFSGRNARIIEAKEGLDLRSLLTLAQKSKSAADFETQLNSGTGYHNLDLNADDKLDYIKVTEYGQGTTNGFSLTVPLNATEEQEVAVIEFEKRADGYHGYSRGHHRMYGHHHGYHRRWGLTDLMLAGYWGSRQSHYRSPHGYGNYPSQFSSSKPVSTVDDYKKRVSGFAGASTAKQYDPSKRTSSVKSPNANKTSKLAKFTRPSRSSSSSSSKKSSFFSRSVRSGSSSSRSSFRSGGK